MDKTDEASMKRARKTSSSRMQRATREIGKGAETVKARARATGKAASEKIGAAKMQADRAAIETTRIITEHPLAAVAAGAAIGALVAGFLPRFLRGSRAKDDSSESDT